MAERLFKVLNTDGTCVHGGTGSWSLPQDGQPGAWMPPVRGPLEPCQNGYHLCREKDLLDWLGPAIFEAEYRGDRLDEEDKIVVREARLIRRLDTWDERTARLFACDCAERVLHLYENKFPDDDRPRNAIAVSRRFAEGKATEDERLAARDAAWAAAWDARAAAWDAAWAASWAARDAARDAAWDAARAASWAARAAAWDAARDEQITLLFHYLFPDETEV